jgi:hypothetical protein
LIEMCACTARSRAEPLRESSARRSAAGAARAARAARPPAARPPRCPKAESIAKLMMSDGQNVFQVPFAWISRLNLFDFTRARRRVQAAKEDRLRH